MRISCVCFLFIVESKLYFLNAVKYIYIYIYIYIRRDDEEEELAMY